MATMLLDSIDKMTFDDYVVRSIDPDAFIVDDTKNVQDFSLSSENISKKLHFFKIRNSSKN
jgi:hypothetical protein